MLVDDTGMLYRNRSLLKRLIDTFAFVDIFAFVSFAVGTGKPVAEIRDVDWYDEAYKLPRLSLNLSDPKWR